jgi:hypothetical protein
MNLTDLIGPVENTDPELTVSHKAILWGQDDLLVQAVDSFLKEMAWEVTHISNNESIESLIHETKRIGAGVVILCQYKSDDDAALPWRLINEQLCLKVVTIGMDTNLLHVYSRQDVILKGTADLLSILGARQLPGCTCEKEVESTKENK